MKLSEIITQVRSLLSEPDATNSRWTDDELTSWANRGQKEIAVYTKCIRKSVSITYPTSNTLPDDLFSIYEVKVDGKRVRPASIRELNDFAKDFETLTGTPSFYYQRQPNTIDLFYKPTDPVTILVYYYAYPTDLSNTTDVPFNDIKQYYVYHNILIDYVLWKAHLKERIFDAAQYYQLEYQRSLATMRMDLEYENSDKVWSIRDVSTDKSSVDDPNYLWTGLERR